MENKRHFVLRWANRPNPRLLKLGHKIKSGIKIKHVTRESVTGARLLLSEQKMIVKDNGP